MPVQPTTDHQLADTAGRQKTTGWRLLLLGGVFFSVGLLLMLVGSEGVDFAGVALAALASVPTLAGLALVLSGLVGRRASQQKPFA